MFKNSKKTKVLSLSLVIFFSTSTLTEKPMMGEPAFSSSGAVIADAVRSIQIPQKLGSLEESFRGDDRRLVILIQDAHAIPEAQRHIQQLIHFFQKEHNVNLIAVEGSPVLLDPFFFRSFPDKERLTKIMNDYMQRGELPGAVAASILNDHPGRYEGLEDWDTYEEGLRHFSEASLRENDILKKIVTRRQALSAKKKEIYSAQLFEVDREIENFYENRISLVNLVIALAKIKPPEAGSELAIMAEAIGSRKNENFAIGLEAEKIALKIHTFLKSLSLNQISRSEMASFNEKLQEFRTSKISPEAFVLSGYEFATRYGLSLEISERLNFLLKSEKNMREIEGTRLFREIDVYAEKVKKSLITREEETALDRESGRLRSLEKLAKLELSYEEWEKIQKIFKENGLRYSNGVTVPAPGAALTAEENSIIEGMDPHLAFYENANRRDQIFYGRVLSEMRREKTGKAILVAGGFHTRGLTRRLQQEGIAYLRIRPLMERVPAETSYREQMSGKVSWQDYFEVEDGKIDLYKAFVRAARDQLLELTTPKGGRVKARGTKPQDAFSPALTPAQRSMMKRWRDRIIRLLAEENRMADAQEYTRFIDELLSKDAEKDELLQKWYLNLDRFVAGLKELETQGLLTKQNVVKLFDQGTMQSLPLGSMLGRGLKVPADLLEGRETAEPLSEAGIRDLDLAGPRAELRDVTMVSKEKKQAAPEEVPTELPEPVEQILSEDFKAVVTRIGDRVRKKVRFKGQAQRETRALEQLDAVKGIPRLLSVSADGRTYELEYIQGSNLNDMKFSVGDTPERTMTVRKFLYENASPFFENLTRLIKEMHDRGIAHGGLGKKENILIFQKNEPYLIDFETAVFRSGGGMLLGGFNRLLFESAKKSDLYYLARFKKEFFPRLDLSPEVEKALKTKPLLVRLQDTYIHIRYGLNMLIDLFQAKEKGPYQSLADKQIRPVERPLQDALRTMLARPGFWLMMLYFTAVMGSLALFTIIFFNFPVITSILLIGYSFMALEFHWSLAATYRAIAFFVERGDVHRDMITMKAEAAYLQNPFAPLRTPNNLMEGFDKIFDFRRDYWPDLWSNIQTQGGPRQFFDFKAILRLDGWNFIRREKISTLWDQTIESWRRTDYLNPYYLGQALFIPLYLLVFGLELAWDISQKNMAVAIEKMEIMREIFWSRERFSPEKSMDFDLRFSAFAKVYDPELYEMLRDGALHIEMRDAAVDVLTDSKENNIYLKDSVSAFYVLRKYGAFDYEKIKKKEMRVTAINRIEGFDTLGELRGASPKLFDSYESNYLRIGQQSMDRIDELKSESERELDSLAAEHGDFGQSTRFFLLWLLGEGRAGKTEADKIFYGDVAGSAVKQGIVREDETHYELSTSFRKELEERLLKYFVPADEKLAALAEKEGIEHILFVDKVPYIGKDSLRNAGNERLRNLLALYEARPVRAELRTGEEEKISQLKAGMASIANAAKMTFNSNPYLFVLRTSPEELDLTKRVLREEILNIDWEREVTDNLDRLAIEKFVQKNKAAIQEDQSSRRMKDYAGKGAPTLLFDMTNMTEPRTIDVIRSLSHERFVILVTGDQGIFEALINHPEIRREISDKRKAILDLTIPPRSEARELAREALPSLFRRQNQKLEEKFTAMTGPYAPTGRRLSKLHTFIFSKSLHQILEDIAAQSQVPKTEIEDQMVVMIAGSIARKQEFVFDSDIDYYILSVSGDEKSRSQAREITRRLNEELEKYGIRSELDIRDQFGVYSFDKVRQILRSEVIKEEDTNLLSPTDMAQRTLLDTTFVLGNRRAYEALGEEIRASLFNQEYAEKLALKGLIQGETDLAWIKTSNDVKDRGTRMFQRFSWFMKMKYGLAKFQDVQEILQALAERGLISPANRDAIYTAYDFLIRLRAAFVLAEKEAGAVKWPALEQDTKLEKVAAKLGTNIEEMKLQFESVLAEAYEHMAAVLGNFYDDGHPLSFGIKSLRSGVRAIRQRQASRVRSELRPATKGVTGAEGMPVAVALAPLELRSEFRKNGVEIPDPELAAEHAVIIVERTGNLGQMSSRLKSLALEAFLKSRYARESVAFDQTVFQREKTILVDSLQRLVSRQASLALYLAEDPNAASEALSRAFLEILGSGMVEINELIYNKNGAREIVGQLMKHSGVFLRPHDFKQPLVFRTDQTGAALLVAAEAAEVLGRQIDASFVPVSATVSETEDPLVIDYVELLKTVTALHLTDLITLQSGLLADPETLRAELLNRLGRFDAEFRSILETRGNGIAIEGTVARAFLEAEVAKAIARAA